jgi:hypothetical protein
VLSATWREPDSCGNVNEVERGGVPLPWTGGAESCLVCWRTIRRFNCQNRFRVGDILASPGTRHASVGKRTGGSVAETHYLLEKESAAQLPGFASSHGQRLRESRQVCSACKRGQFRPVKSTQPTFWLRKGGCQFTHVPRPAKTTSNSAHPSGLFPALQRG